MPKAKRQLSPEQLERLRQDLKDRTRNADGKPLRPIFEAVAKKHRSTRGAVEQQYYNNVRPKSGRKANGAGARVAANGAKRSRRRKPAKTGRPRAGSGTLLGGGTLARMWRQVREQERVAARESGRAQKLRRIAVQMERRIKVGRRDATRAAARAENDARTLLAKAGKV